MATLRALALSPKLFLLDEPLSALDAKLREDMQVELRQLQQKLGITTIVVTHDQREAMTMADLVVVMGEGRIRQAAKPVEIYRQPADTFVADFIGATNLLSVRPGEGQAALFGDMQRIHIGPQGNRTVAGAPFQSTNNACPTNPFGDIIQSEFAQFRGDKGGGTLLTESEFRVGMQVVTPLHHVGVKAGWIGHRRLPMKKDSAGVPL